METFFFCLHSSYFPRASAMDRLFLKCTFFAQPLVKTSKYFVMGTVKMKHLLTAESYIIISSLSHLSLNFSDFKRSNIKHLSFWFFAFEFFIDSKVPYVPLCLGYVYGFLKRSSKLIASCYNGNNFLLIVNGIEMIDVNPLISNELKTKIRSLTNGNISQKKRTPHKQMNCYLNLFNFFPNYNYKCRL